MIVQIDEGLSIEIYFDPADRKEGYLDEIRFRLIQSGKKPKLFPADVVSFLLTADQADDLAIALHEAHAASRLCPRENKGKRKIKFQI